MSPKTISSKCYMKITPLINIYSSHITF